MNVTVGVTAPALALFAGALRAHGIAATVRDEIDAATALAVIDGTDREELRLALRIALKVPRPAWRTFDRLFATLWSSGAAAVMYPEPAPALTGDRPRAAPRLPSWDPDLRRLHVPGDCGHAPEDEDPTAGSRPAASPTALLRRKSFDGAGWSAAELAAMERMLARLARRLATCPSRRLMPASGAAAGRLDPRRSYRRALATGGELLSFARRKRAVEEPRLVFLCDTSGSMDPHTRFLLMFVLALRRAARRTELFVFNTALCHIEREVFREVSREVSRKVLAGSAMRDPLRLTLDRLAARVPDWSGGTRIGESLTTFADRWLPRLGGPRTVIVILSDGLDRGEPDLLAEAVRRIRARVRRVVWLNPLLGGADYQPLARGMAAALPHIDCFATAHDLESLERLLPHLVV